MMASQIVGIIHVMRASWSSPVSYPRRNYASLAHPLINKVPRCLSEYAQPRLAAVTRAAARKPAPTLEWMEVPLGKQDRLPVMAYCLGMLTHAVRGNEHSSDEAICISWNDLSAGGFNANTPSVICEGFLLSWLAFVNKKGLFLCGSLSYFHKIYCITHVIHLNWQTHSSNSHQLILNFS